MLEARNLSFRYAEDTPWLFRGFDLTVRPGESVGLSGPSGRGKSTLAKILCNFLAPHSGSVRIDGQSCIRGYHPTQLLFQHPELAVNPRFTGRQIIAEAWTPDNDLLDALRIKPQWLQRYPHELSGGELQRICVARALDPRTRYLIADEMTSMLDAITQAQIWNVVLQRAKAHNMGMLVISHDSALLERVCSRQECYFLTAP